MVSDVAAYAWAGAAAAAQEDLDNLVDEQQGDGGGEADQPLAPTQRSQAQDALQEAELGRQDGYQQRHAIEKHLVSIMNNVPVESGGCLASSAESPGDAEEGESHKAHGSPPCPCRR